MKKSTTIPTIDLTYDSDSMDIDDTLSSVFINSINIHEQTFSPMDIDYDHPTDEELIKKTINNVKNTVFPNAAFDTTTEREYFAIKHHKNFGNDFNTICRNIAENRLRYNYCSWCYAKDDGNNLIIEHLHIIDANNNRYAGKYRGVLCKKCNVYEGLIKNKSNADKTDYLYNKIKEQINYDKNWCKERIEEWYGIEID